MKLLTKANHAKLRKNAQNRGQNYFPVVKFFTPWGANTWLFTELGDDGDSLFGLGDLGMGFPELGYVSLAELQTVKGPFGLGVERDLGFKANKPLFAYATEAQEKGRICA